MRTLEFIRTRAPLARRPVVSPPGIRVTGRSLSAGLDIVMNPGQHTAADLMAAIVANNPADAGKMWVSAKGDVDIYPRGGHVHIRIGQSSPA